MELEFINKKDEDHKQKGVEGKQPLKDQTPEEEEAAHYSSLTKLQEDVYTEAIRTKSAEKEEKTVGNARVYRVVCVILSIICLILLIAVIFLGTKVSAELTSCPSLSAVPSTCTKQTCKTLYNIKERPLCPEDWPTIDGYCYFMSTRRLDWAQSQSYCVSKGGSLAVIKSQAVQDFLSENGGLMYWIGLSQSNGTWAWVDNTVLQQRYWSVEPARGDCVYLKTKDQAQKNWFRENCHQYTYFICQMQIQ